MGLFFNMQILLFPFLEKEKKKGARYFKRERIEDLKRVSRKQVHNSSSLDHSDVDKNHLAKIIELELPGGQFN